MVRRFVKISIMYSREAEMYTITAISILPTIIHNRNEIGKANAFAKMRKRTIQVEVAKK